MTESVRRGHAATRDRIYLCESRGDPCGRSTDRRPGRDDCRQLLGATCTRKERGMWGEQSLSSPNGAVPCGSGRFPRGATRNEQITERSVTTRISCMSRRRRWRRVQPGSAMARLEVLAVLWVPHEASANASIKDYVNAAFETSRTNQSPQCTVRATSVEGPIEGEFSTKLCFLSIASICDAGGFGISLQKWA